MTTVVVDLYDSGVLVCNKNNILIDSESFALVESNSSIAVDSIAKQQAHLRPREISTNFWSRLSNNSSTKHIISNAELAFKHLQHVWQQVDEADQVILAVPNTFNKQDLGLLLGICDKSSIPVIGIVSKAVLAGKNNIGNYKSIYLDVLQQQTVITELQQIGGTITASNTNFTIQQGIQSVTNNFAKQIAQKFIVDTRFDPLHIAADEQVFYEKLSDWCIDLTSKETVKCQLISNSTEYYVELEKKFMLDINQNIFREIYSGLAALAQNKNILILCSPTCEKIFGLIEYLELLPGCAVKQLNNLDIAQNAIINKDQIKTKNNQIHYTTALKHSNLEAKNIIFNPGALVDTQKKPTHMLINGHAYALPEVAYLTYDKQGDINISQHLDENSTCKITNKDFSVHIEALNNGSVYLNGLNIDHQYPVQIDDRLKLNNHSIELILICVN